MTKTMTKLRKANPLREAHCARCGDSIVYMRVRLTKTQKKTASKPLCVLCICGAPAPKKASAQL